MGKNLHWSIRPFIEKALTSHMSVQSFEAIDLPDFYAYRIKRRKGMSDVIVVLSDDYYFGSAELYSKSEILKDGGFILIARPEANGDDTNEPEIKLGIGKIGKLLGALNVEEYWEYVRPKKKYER